MSSRRSFLKNTTLGLTAATLAPLVNKSELFYRDEFEHSKDLPVGIADYTFLNFDIPQSIRMMQRLDIHQMTIKNFHLPYDSSKEKIDEVVKQYHDGGISIYGVGVI